MSRHGIPLCIPMREGGICSNDQSMALGRHSEIHLTGIKGARGGVARFQVGIASTWRLVFRWGPTCPSV